MCATGCSGSSQLLCAKHAVLLLGGLNISAEALVSLISVLLSRGFYYRRILDMGGRKPCREREKQADSTSMLLSLSTILHLNCLERQRWGEL